MNKHMVYKPDNFPSLQLRSEKKQSPETEQLRVERRKLFEAMKLIFAGSAEAGDDTLAAGLELLQTTTIRIKDQAYKMTDFIGAGSFGFVIEVESEEYPGEKVALKLSAPYHLQDQLLDPEETNLEKRGHAEHTRGFIREVAALKKINELDPDSAYPTYVDAQLIPNPEDPSERILGLVMEKIEGENLEKILPQEGLSNDPEVLFDIAIQLAKAIAVTHRAGFVHRDIKPENAMIDANNKVWLLDLGLTSFQNPGASEVAIYKHTVPNIDVGSDDYLLENEQDPLSPARDVYALGRTFQQLLVGETFKKSMVMRMRIGLLHNDDLKQFADLAYRMTRSNAAERPSIQEVITEISALQHNVQQGQQEYKQAA